MLDPVAKVAKSIIASIKVSSSVPFAVEIPIARKSIITMHRNMQLNAILCCIHHNIIDAIEDCIIPLARLIIFQATKGFDFCTFLERKCSYINQ